MSRKRHEKTIDYDYVSGIYDLVRTGDSEMVHQLLRGVRLSSTSRVLDIGCGTANNTLLFSRASGASVTGLDLSYGMLFQAQAKVRDLSFIQAPADMIPIADSSFDFVYMTEVVHHLPEVQDAMKEIYRLLKDSGRTCIVTQSHAQIADRMTSRFFPSTIAIDQARYPSIPELKEFLTGAGFTHMQPNIYKFAPVRLGEEYLETVENRGYSMLHKIANDEYIKGLNQLRKAMSSDEPLTYEAGYTFVWAYKKHA